MSDVHDSHAQARLLLGSQADEVVETHCAVVFLTGETAWKIKKPVDFGYLDFTTVEKRRRAVRRELRLNAQNAPDIYLATETVAGEPVLRMRRFDRAAVLSERPEAVDAAQAERLGRTIARFHASARSRPIGTVEDLAYVVGSNAGHLVELAPRIGERARRVVEKTQAAFDQARPLLEARVRAGLVRRCHGDLHLGNILVEDARPILFDRIEFSDRLSRIDVLYDLAFLLMDLDFRGRPEAANRVLNAWLDEAARSFGDTVFEGLALLPLFLSMRAAVRCHVAGHAGDFALSARYLEAAERLIAPGAASLTAVGGYSGSGKTTFARAKAPGLGGPPGAVILRSDEIRKRLHGAGPLDPLPESAYAPEATARVYARLFDEARLCLDAGRAVVLDAAFLDPAMRDTAEALAPGAFQGWWLELPDAERLARVAGRTGDASDAGVEVAARQASVAPGPLRWAKAAPRR